MQFLYLIQLKSHKTVKLMAHCNNSKHKPTEVSEEPTTEFENLAEVVHWMWWDVQTGLTEAIDSNNENVKIWFK